MKRGLIMVNLELYRIFVVVAKEMNITRASEKLNISQPAVTKHIKNLENELGTILFNRNKRNIFNRKRKRTLQKNRTINKFFTKIGIRVLWFKRY